MFSPTAKMAQITHWLTVLNGSQVWKKSRACDDRFGRIHWYSVKTATAPRANPIGQPLPASGLVRPEAFLGGAEEVVVISHLFRGRLAEEAFRLEHHQQDENREDDRLGPFLAEREHAAAVQV